MAFTSEALMLTDQERLRVAEAKYAELEAGRGGLSDGEFAERINRETGVGSDVARLVVMGHSARR